MATPRILDTATSFDGTQHRHGGASTSSSAPAGDAIARPTTAVAPSSRPPDGESTSSPPPPPPPPPTTRARPIHLTMRLFPSVLLMSGLAIFVDSFFLSRTPFELRSSCGVGSAGSLLAGALGVTDAEASYLREVGLLSDAAAEDGGGRGGGGGTTTPTIAGAGRPASPTPSP